MAETKEKQYVSDNAQLMAEWDWEKNIEIEPTQLTLGSHKKVWWTCSKGHEWQATIASRNYGRGCPYCSGRYAIKGCNDLLTINPELAKEWNYEKNTGLSPTDVLPNSTKKVWWKCSEGHEWEARIDHRNQHIGCPQCAGQKVIIGYNDLQTSNPTLAKEWNIEKNNGLMPTDIMSHSHKKVWWKCQKGHEWQAMVKHRNNGSGCPVCNSERKSSFPEYAIEYYLNEHGIKTIHPYTEQGYELDVYIPSINVAIEYDGYLWHKDTTKRDLEKNAKCQTDGILLYRIREGLPSLNDSSIDYIIHKDRKDLPEALKQILLQIIGLEIDINFEKDSIAIENLREHSEKEHSLLFINLQIAKEWNYEKNGNLKPEYVTANSSKKVWWKCQKGHEWQARIADRTKGTGCPICAKEKRNKAEFT